MSPLLHASAATVAVLMALWGNPASTEPARPVGAFKAGIPGAENTWNP